MYIWLHFESIVK